MLSLLRCKFYQLLGCREIVLVHVVSRKAEHLSSALYHRHWHLYLILLNAEMTISECEILWNP